jgi:hypothetical protein
MKEHPARSAEHAWMPSRNGQGQAIVNGRQDEGQALWAGVGREQMMLEARVFWHQHVGDTERAVWVRQAADSR